MSEILIETARGDFEDAVDSVLTISLSERHLTMPIITIGVRENEEVSSYNFFINEVVETSPFSYDVLVGMSAPAEPGWDDAPVILVHAMSYQ